ncbi:MAG TPA: PH domain-containing protein [Gammaproteobacteria bacterium]|nr:PH domain-containing protein [Gammaproteobacteria bacterium]
MSGDHAFDPLSITRPESALLKYYFITSLFAFIAFPIVFLPRFFRYETLRYAFDDEGVAMSWGFVFRKEIYLTYRRIQDIHVTRNLIQRWLGLANVAVQTASGGGDGEMVIEGVREPDLLRDFLYSNMRGARGVEGAAPPALGDAAASADDEVTRLLREIRDSLRGARTGGGERA